MGVAAADELARRGHEALAAADWARARAFFEQAAEADESAEVLAGLGDALQFGGEYARAIELKERAFAEYERRGLRAQAAELARWLAFLYASVHGNVAAANGWMARAESVLEGVEERAARGWVFFALLVGGGLELVMNGPTGRLYHHVGLYGYVVAWFAALVIAYKPTFVAKYRALGG